MNSKYLWEKKNQPETVEVGTASDLRNTCGTHSSLLFMANNTGEATSKADQDQTYRVELFWEDAAI